MKNNKRIKNNLKKYNSRNQMELGKKKYRINYIQISNWQKNIQKNSQNFKIDRENMKI